MGEMKEADATMRASRLRQGFFACWFTHSLARSSFSVIRRPFVALCERTFNLSVFSYSTEARLVRIPFLG